MHMHWLLIQQILIHPSDYITHQHKHQHSYGGIKIKGTRVIIKVIVGRVGLWWCGGGLTRRGGVDV